MRDQWWGCCWLLGWDNPIKIERGVKNALFRGDKYTDRRRTEEETQCSGYQTKYWTDLSARFNLKRSRSLRKAFG